MGDLKARVQALEDANKIIAELLCKVDLAISLQKAKDEVSLFCRGELMTETDALAVADKERVQKIREEAVDDAEEAKAAQLIVERSKRRYQLEAADVAFVLARRTLLPELPLEACLQLGESEHLPDREGRRCI